MVDNHTVPISQLLKISDKICDTNFSFIDFYSILLLSLITVTQYSRKNHRLTVVNRIELATIFTPELANHMRKTKKIDDETYDNILRLYERRYSEIPLIMEAYLCAATYLSSKTKKSGNRECVIN